MKLAIVIGAATPPGRLAGAAACLADALQRTETSVDVLDLAADPLDPCDGRPLDACSEATRRALELIQAADAVVLFSPTYRASYPGVLKNLLDLLPIEALRGKAVGTVALGASDHHFLGVDNQLRQVLAWFGAVVAPVSVYLTNRDFDEDKRLSDRRAEQLRELGQTLTALASSLEGLDLGPAPLAARVPG